MLFNQCEWDMWDEKTALWVNERRQGHFGTAVSQLAVSEKREWESTAGISVSILQKMSIETVSNILNWYAMKKKKNLYFWQHYFNNRQVTRTRMCSLKRKKKKQEKAVTTHFRSTALIQFEVWHTGSFLNSLWFHLSLTWFFWPVF